MNEKKSVESQLRSWRPRRPLPTVKWRLLIASAAFLPRAARFAGWCLPVTACVLLAFLSLNSEPGMSNISSRREFVMQTLSSNQNYVAYLPGAAEEGLNAPLPMTTPTASIFRWTNADGSPSLIRFTPSR